MMDWTVVLCWAYILTSGDPFRARCFQIIVNAHAKGKPYGIRLDVRSGGWDVV